MEANKKVGRPLKYNSDEERRHAAVICNTKSRQYKIKCLACNHVMNYPCKHTHKNSTKHLENYCSYIQNLPGCVGETFPNNIQSNISQIKQLVNKYGENIVFEKL